MKLKQDRERKKSTKFYCKEHKLHYHQKCVKCELERLGKTDMQWWY